MNEIEGDETVEPDKHVTNASSRSSGESGLSWLSGWGGLAACALVIFGALLAFGGLLGGTQDAGKWLPLLFVLPCAIMMFVCMRNMGGAQSDAGPPSRTGAPRSGVGDKR